MQHLNPELLRRYHAGKCTPEERKQVEDWLAAEDNIYAEEDIVLADKRLQQEIWQRIEPAVRENTGGRRKPVLHLAVKLAAAACIAALICIATLYLFVSENKTGYEQPIISVDTYTVPRGSRSKIILSDSTVLYALGGTTVQFPAEFSGAERNLILVQGEIFLDVSHRPEQPFIVHSSGARIKVLGTRFNVRNAGDESFMSVSLVKGSVQFSSRDQILRILKPGEVLRFDKVQDTVAGVGKIKDDDPADGWTKGILNFEKTPLHRVFKRLEEYYGIRFHPQSGINTDMSVTATIDNLSVREVLEMMQFSTGLSYVQEDSTIIVKKSHKK